MQSGSNSRVRGLKMEINELLVKENKMWRQRAKAFWLWVIKTQGIFIVGVLKGINKTEYWEYKILRGNGLINPMALLKFSQNSISISSSHPIHVWV